MITADVPSSTTCPVAPLALEALSLVRALKRYDEHGCGDLWTRTAERLEQVEDAAATAHATSRAGIFFQACLIAAALDWWDTFDEGEADEQRRRKSRAARAAVSTALAAHTPEVDGLAGYYMPAAFGEALAA